MGRKVGWGGPGEAAVFQLALAAEEHCQTIVPSRPVQALAGAYNARENTAERLARATHAGRSGDEHLRLQFDLLRGMKADGPPHRRSAFATRHSLYLLEWKQMSGKP